MTISESLQWGYKNLRKKSASAGLDAEVLLAFVLNKNKEFLYTFPERKLSKQQLKKFKKIISQKIRGVPVAYLVGHKEFYGLDFIVNKNVLIPRPETELIVDEVLKKIITNSNKNILIDIGTGSGCIPVAISQHIKNNRGKNLFFATDTSSSALKIARRNARRHQVKIHLLKGNILQPFIKQWKSSATTSLIITANLPYLTTEQMKEKTIKFEPRQALHGGKDGLDLYLKLLQQIKKMNPPTADIFLEIDPAQSKKISSLIKKILPKTRVEIKKDLARKDRLVTIKI